MNAWLTITEASVESGVPASTLKRWASADLVRWRRRGERLIEINRASLVARLADQPRLGRKPSVARKEE